MTYIKSYLKKEKTRDHTGRRHTYPFLPSSLSVLTRIPSFLKRMEGVRSRESGESEGQGTKRHGTVVYLSRKSCTTSTSPRKNTTSSGSGTLPFETGFQSRLGPSCLRLCFRDLRSHVPLPHPPPPNRNRRCDGRDLGSPVILVTQHKNREYYLPPSRNRFRTSVEERESTEPLGGTDPSGRVL